MVNAIQKALSLKHESLRAMFMKRLITPLIATLSLFMLLLPAAHLRGRFDQFHLSLYVQQRDDEDQGKTVE